MAELNATGDSRVLVVDDEPAMRHMLRLVLERAGYEVGEAGDGEEALRLLAGARFELILCDIRMPGIDGLAFLREAARQRAAATIIMMSAYGSIETAVECMKLGAYDFVAKPFKPDEILLTLRNARERLQLLRENQDLRSQVLACAPSRQIVYRSQAMAQVAQTIARMADSVLPVLICGETGTGKELVARALHSQGSRRSQPFHAVNCGALAPALVESELFGHAKGAYTGADRERQGLFSAAHRGVLFLDEVGELPLELQPKLLRVLEEGELRRIGETKVRYVDVRLVAATARDLKAEVAAGRFREDLYYRLAVLEIQVPPLRERPEDIAPLAEHFLRRIAEREGRLVPQLLPDALEALQAHGWPGNVRELENFLEKAMIFCREPCISQAQLPWDGRRKPRNQAQDLSLKQATRRLEEEYIRKALSVTDGNRTRAAQLLEISLRGLLYKMKELGIE